MAEDFDLPEAVPVSPVAIPEGEEACSARGEESSPDLAEASHRRKRSAMKELQMDVTMELRNSELTQWNNEYVGNMTEVSKHKERSRLQAQARKNALFWVSGIGIGGIGIGLGSSHLETPLGQFGGEMLLEAVTGVRSDAAGKKRDREGDGDEDDQSVSEGRRVRSRQDDDDQIGRGDQAALQDEGLNLTFDEDVSTTLNFI